MEYSNVFKQPLETFLDNILKEQNIKNLPKPSKTGLEYYSIDDIFTNYHTIKVLGNPKNGTLNNLKLHTLVDKYFKEHDSNINFKILNKLLFIIGRTNVFEKCIINETFRRLNHKLYNQLINYIKPNTLISANDGYKIVINALNDILNVTKKEFEKTFINEKGDVFSSEESKIEHEKLFKTNLTTLITRDVYKNISIHHNEFLTHYKQDSEKIIEELCKLYNKDIINAYLDNNDFLSDLYKDTHLEIYKTFITLI